MNMFTRRRWLLSAAAVSCAAVPAIADSPKSEIRIAATMLPVTSRSIRLKNTRETRTVVTAIAADPRGELLAASGDDLSIRILDAATLKTVRTLQGHRDLIRTLAFDSEGDLLVSAGNDGQMIVWDREHSFNIKQKYNGTAALTCVRFTPQGSELAAVGFNDEIYLIGSDKHHQPNLHCDCRDLRAVAYRDDMQMLAVAGRSGSLYLFDPETGDLLGEHSLHTSRIHDIAFVRESNLIVCAGEDGKVTIFDSQLRSLIHRISVTTSKLFAVAVISSELVAVAGSDNVIRIVNITNGEIVRTLKGHSGSVSTLASAGGWLFSGSYDATLKRWSVSDITASRQRIAEGELRIDR